MGSYDSNDETPVHNVTVKSFAMGKTEVTQGQWFALMGYNPSKFQDCGDRCPVERVSVKDVQAFIQKLNTKSGQQYRLPSESEWEYAARAGSNKNYPWGDLPGVNNANCNGCGSQWDSQTTAPVGQFTPNTFGLYDMHGNVWEWVEDCWHDFYSSAPNDGAAWTTACTSPDTVYRGGSWNNGPTYLRSSNRGRMTQGSPSSSGGLRLARAIVEP